MLLAVTLAAVLLPAGTASAATFIPTTTADGVNGACTPALCTLRDAVAAVNAGTGGDTIQLSAGRYELTMGELDVTQNATIAGASARTTILDGNSVDRVLKASNLVVPIVNVTIRDLTVTGGFSQPSSSNPSGDGGGIVNFGRMHLSRVVITSNQAMFSGGGIVGPFESGVAPVTTIEDSLIAGNAIAGGAGNGQGGGIAVFGDATITNTTIANNTVSNPGINEGGGIVSAKSAVAPTPPTLTLLNTTIAGNAVAGGNPANVGGGLAGASLGGVPLLTQLIAKNTIIAGNTVNGSAQNCGLVTALSTSFNLSGDASCGFSDPGSKQNANPQLRPLANNGGMTDTLAIGDGSPALNTGTNSGCPAADQRGTTRPQVTTCDIGAFEARAPDLVVEQRAAGKRKKKKKKRGLATVAAKGGRRAVFVVTVTNKGEQGAPGTELRVKPPRRSKVKLSGCDSIAKQKGKKGKGKGKKSELKRKRKRGKRALICSLGNVGAGASRTVRIKIRPRRGGKVVSRVSVTSMAADADPTTNTARTKVRVKRRR